MSGSVSRTYDNDFRITSRSINGANTISFGYDADSLLTSAGSETLTYDSANGLLTATYSYDANGISAKSAGFIKIEAFRRSKFLF